MFTNLYSKHRMLVAAKVVAGIILSLLCTACHQIHTRHIVTDLNLARTRGANLTIILCLGLVCRSSVALSDSRLCDFSSGENNVRATCEVNGV
jgi:hypothetical protein